MPHGGESARFVQALDRSSFMLSDALGDVEERPVAGFFYDDTRYLNCFVLTLAGKRAALLSSRQVDYYSAAFFLTNEHCGALPASSLSVKRYRFVGDGLHEEIVLESHCHNPLEFELRLSCGSDFASIFEVREQNVRKVGRWR